MSKTCLGCKKNKELVEFYKHRGKCKECIKKYSKIKRAQKKLKKRNDERPISALERWVLQFFPFCNFYPGDYSLEYQVDWYFIDIAFPRYKLAIELDGKQHREYENKVHDKIKDDYLIAKGWSVMRIQSVDAWSPRNLAYRLVDIHKFIRGDRPITGWMEEMTNYALFLREMRHDNDDYDDYDEYEEYDYADEN